MRIIILVLVFLASCSQHKQAQVKNKAPENIVQENEYYSQGKGFFYKKLFIKAIDAFTESIKSDPNLAEAYSYRCASYYQINMQKEAMEDCIKAISINPNLEDAYNNRGNVHASMQLDNLAINDYTRAIEIANKKEDKFYMEHRLYYDNRATIYYKQKKYTLALKDVEDALTIVPKYYYKNGSFGQMFFQQDSFAQELREAIISSMRQNTK